jgi:O-antigen/teichoic acid export membrane protein
MSTKNTIRNLISNSVSLFSSFFIGFLITPFLISKVGIEAYGFIALANQLITYISLITIALNSMAGRFVAIEIHRKNLSKANLYFNSVFFSNIFLSIIMILPFIFIILNISSILVVPDHLLNDVKLLFLFIFINYLISLNSSVFGIATFTTNKLNLDSQKILEANILKIFLVFFIFSFLYSNLSIIGLITIFITIYTTFFKVYYTITLLPNLKISLKYFSFKHTFELFLSGSWNILLKFSQLLMSGLDLLLSNLFLTSYMTGILALARTIPNLLYTLVGSFVNIFVPDFVYYYSIKDSKSLLKSLQFSIKLMSLIVNIPLAFLFIYGDYFYEFWIPEYDSLQLQIITLGILGHLVISGSIHSLYNIYTVTNKLFVNTFGNLFVGLLSLLFTLILLTKTNLGVYAIVFSNSLIGTIYNFTFTPIYVARLLNLKWNKFYNDIFISLASFILLSIIFFLIRTVYVPTNWLTFFMTVFFCGLIGLSINFFVSFQKEDRISLIQSLRNFLKI